MRVASGVIMMRSAVIIAAGPREARLVAAEAFQSGKRSPLGQRKTGKHRRLMSGLVNQERRMGWTCNAHRFAAVLAAFAIAATCCTGHARARDRRAEEVLASCKSDVIRFCDRFTGRSDVDVAMFCLRDNFKNLHRECRRMMPTAANENDVPRQSLNKRPVGLHREARQLRTRTIVKYSD